MARYCFLLQVRPELLPEYRQRHAEVWPDTLRAARRAGGGRRPARRAADEGFLLLARLEVPASTQGNKGSR